MSNSNTATKTKMPKVTKTEVKPVEAPVADKKVRVKKVEPVVAPVTPVVPVTVSETVVRSSADGLSALHDSLKALGADVALRVRELAREVLEVSKAVRRDARAGKKHRKKPEDMSPEELVKYEARKANNAFNKPRLLTDELCVFMGVPAKSERSQTAVTKFVSEYIKSHSCFDPSFKRTIVPDQKLGKLLRAKDGDVVTYLNLQRYLKVHFVKPVSA